MGESSVTASSSSCAIDSRSESSPSKIISFGSGISGGISSGSSGGKSMSSEITSSVVKKLSSFLSSVSSNFCGKSRKSSTGASVISIGSSRVSGRSKVSSIGSSTKGFSISVEVSCSGAKSSCKGVSSKAGSVTGSAKSSATGSGSACTGSGLNAGCVSSCFGISASFCLSFSCSSESCCANFWAFIAVSIAYFAESITASCIFLCMSWAKFLKSS